MKATVKVAYYDNAGLHRPREVVEVSKPNPWVEIIEEPKTVKAEKPAKVEKKAEEKVEEPKKASKPKKSKKG